MIYAPPPTHVSQPEKGVEGPQTGSYPSTPGMKVELNASPIFKKIQRDPALRKVFIGRSQILHCDQH